MRRHHILLVFGALAAFALPACSADHTDNAATGESAAVAPAAPPPQASAGNAKSVVPQQKQQQPQQQQSAAPAQVPVGPNRQLVRSARLTIASPHVLDTVDRAREIALNAGGYTGSERGGTDTATLDLAVPSDRLDSTIAELSRLGNLTTREQSAQDVTDQVVDVQSRLATQRKSVDRVRALLDQATSISDITSLESELTRRESDLESLQSRNDSLGGKVANSTITLTVSLPPPPPAQADTRPDVVKALASGWHAFVTFGNAALATLAAVVPFALLLGLPAYLLWRHHHPRNPKTAES
jgi:hypothetical protein